MSDKNLVKVRYIRERYQENGKPEVNPYTGEPAVNHGILVEVDHTGKCVTRLPGDVFEATETEARRRCREQPLQFALDDSWRAKLELWSAGDRERERRRTEYVQMLKTREAEAEAMKRMQASMAMHTVKIQDMAREQNATEEAERSATRKAEEASAQLADALRRMQELQDQAERRAREQAERDEEQRRRIADLEAQLKPQPSVDAPPADSNAEPSPSDGSRRRRGGGG